MKEYSFTFARGDIAKKRIMMFPRSNISNVVELCHVVGNARMVRYLDGEKGTFASYLCDRGFGTNFEIIAGEAYEVYFKGDADFSIEVMD